MFWWFFILTIVIFYYFTIYRPHQKWKTRKIPYLKSWPVFGNFGPSVLRIKPFPELVQELYYSHKTRYFGMYQFMLPTIAVRDPELIKQICIKNFENFTDHRLFISEDVEPLFGKCILALKGQKWKNMRSTLSPAFTSSKMRTMFILIKECAVQCTNYFETITSPNKPTSIEMKNIFKRIANDVIASCAFGIQCDSLQEQNNEFYGTINNASQCVGTRSLKFYGNALSPFIMKLFSVKFFKEEVSNFFRYIIQSTIKVRDEKKIYRPDMIHLLMEARKGKLRHEDSSKSKNEDNAGFATVEESDIGRQIIKQELSDDDITAQAVVFFIAGFDAVSTTMSHVANELATNPEIQEKLQSEIDKAAVDCNNVFTYEIITKMKYLDMVVSETLRKWPPAPAIDRMCTKSVTINFPDSNEKPLEIRKGEAIWIPIYAIQRDPKYYPDPDRFDPERFSDKNKDKIIPFTYNPFGCGPRNCIASRFALLEIKTIFVHLLSKFSFVVVDKTDIPFKFTKADFTLTQANGFWLGLTLRTNNTN